MKGEQRRREEGSEGRPKVVRSQNIDKRAQHNEPWNSASQIVGSLHHWRSEAISERVDQFEQFNI